MGKQKNDTVWEAYSGQPRSHFTDVVTYSFLFSLFVPLPRMCLCVCFFICVFPEFDMVSRHLYYTRYEYTNPESK